MGEGPALAEAPHAFQARAFPPARAALAGCPSPRAAPRPRRDSARVSVTLGLVNDTGNGRLAVRVKPRASRTRVVGLREGALEIAVAAPPVDGLANQELCAFVARAVGVAKSKVHLVSGATGRNKLLTVEGVDAVELERVLLGGAE